MARTRVTPFVCGADGGVRAGVLATLVDVVGGLLGVRILRPDWMATADLTVQLARPAVGPVVEARAELVRRGRTTMVIEALVVNVDEDGAEVLDLDGASAPVAWSTMTFAVLPGGNRTATGPLPVDLPTKMEIAGNGLDRPLVEMLGMTVEESAEGRVSLPVHPYLHNSIEAVQGGAMALLGDVAAAEALGAAAGLPGCVDGGHRPAGGLSDAGPDRAHRQPDHRARGRRGRRSGGVGRQRAWWSWSTSGPGAG